MWAAIWAIQATQTERAIGVIMWARGVYLRERIVFIYINFDYSSKSSQVTSTLIRLQPLHYR